METQVTNAPTATILAMSNELIEQYRASRKLSDPKNLNQLRSPLLFGMYKMTTLPMAWLAGCKVKQVDLEMCQITVPFRWINQNPFKSTYFAVLSMAAEMSTGMLAMIMTRDSNPSVSMLVTHLEADFVKKATGITTFTCNEGKQMNEVIERAILTGEPQSFSATAIGTSEKGDVEARFKVEWSFKMRSKK
jgi:hypothetical protein